MFIYRAALVNQRQHLSKTLFTVLWLYVHGSEQYWFELLYM